MAPNAKALLNLTAAELMSASIVMVPEEMSLQGAAHLLAQARVTGAPVVNHLGRCVGVLSGTDFVHWADKCRDGVHVHGPVSAYCAAWQMVDPDLLPEDAVHNYMTHDPVQVSPATTICALARMMIDAHIHRVIVVDVTGKPVGIVSSTDVLAAVARADQARAGTISDTEKMREAVAC